MSLAQVLSQGGSEWANIINGRTSPTMAGRYPSANTPSTQQQQTLFTPSGNQPPAFYARIDWDATTASGQPSSLLGLPSGNNCWPTYGSGWDNGSPAECQNHPAGFNLSQPMFPAWNIDALLNYGNTGSTGLIVPAPGIFSGQTGVGDLLHLCPQNFANPRIRRLVTPISYHLYRSSMMANRVDLNQQLTPYPAPGANGQITDTTTFNKAQTDRQNLVQ